MWEAGKQTSGLHQHSALNGTSISPCLRLRETGERGRKDHKSQGMGRTLKTLFSCYGVSVIRNTQQLWLSVQDLCTHTHIRHTQTHAHIYTLDIGRSLVKEKAVGRTGNEMRKGSREWIPWQHIVNMYNIVYIYIIQPYTHTHTHDTGGVGTWWEKEVGNGYYISMLYTLYYAHTHISVFFFHFWHNKI